MVPVPRDSPHMVPRSSWSFAEPEPALGLVVRLPNTKVVAHVAHDQDGRRSTLFLGGAQAEGVHLSYIFHHLPGMSAVSGVSKRLWRVFLVATGRAVGEEQFTLGAGDRFDLCV